MRRELSLSGVGSRLIDKMLSGYRRLDCPRCDSVIGVRQETIVGAPVECCVCHLVFYPLPDPHVAEPETP